MYVIAYRMDTTALDQIAGAPVLSLTASGTHLGLRRRTARRLAEAAICFAR